MKNILLLQNERIITSDLRRIIETGCHADVHLAHDSSTALRFAREIGIDLLITDVDLGERIDGVDVATQLDSLYQTPILFLMSSSDEEMLVRASRLTRI